MTSGLVRGFRYGGHASLLVFSGNYGQEQLQLTTTTCVVHPQDRGYIPKTVTIAGVGFSDALDRPDRLDATR